MIFFRYLRYVRVLVTEDDEDLRIAVEAALRAAGFAVDVAADLPEADEALAVNAYDCVVFDRMLPSGDALEYVHNRRRAGWPVPVLFLTARDAVADRIAGVRLAYTTDCRSLSRKAHEDLMTRTAGNRPEHHVAVHILGEDCGQLVDSR